MPEFEIITEKFERRTYLKGGFRGKFVGYLDSQKSDRKHEDFYDLEVLSGEVSVNKSDFRTWDEGDEFDECISIEKFLTKLPNPLDCAVTYEDDSVKNFKINLRESKLQNFTLSHRLYEEDKVFATIEGEISGYLKHFDTVEKKIEIIPLETIESKIEADLKTGSEIEETVEIIPLEEIKPRDNSEVINVLLPKQIENETNRFVGFFGKVLASIILLYLLIASLVFISTISFGLVISFISFFFGLTMIIIALAGNYKYLGYFSLIFATIILIKILMLLAAFTWQVPLLALALVVFLYWTFPKTTNLYLILKWIIALFSLVIITIILF